MRQELFIHLRKKRKHMKQQQHLFTNKMLRALLVPIIMEQLLNALMGTVDTMMVSNVGSAAISAVSLGLYQCTDYSGLFWTGSWRYHYLYPVSWTEELRDGEQISQAGTFYYNSHFCLHRCAWTCFPCTAS